MTQLLLLPHLFCSDIVQNVEQSLQAPHVTAKLESKDGTEVYASAHIDGISSSWSRLKFMLSSNATADAAQLTLYIEGEANLAVRLVSLFPAENVKGEMLQPFRADILQYLKDLHPRSGLCQALYSSLAALQLCFRMQPCYVLDEPGYTFLHCLLPEGSLLTKGLPFLGLF